MRGARGQPYRPHDQPGDQPYDDREQGDQRYADA